MTLTAAINVLAVVALITLVVTVAAGVVDLARECWQPEQVEIEPGYRVLPRQPYDFENEAP